MVSNKEVKNHIKYKRFNIIETKKEEEPCEMKENDIDTKDNFVELENIIIDKKRRNSSLEVITTPIITNYSGSTPKHRGITPKEKCITPKNSKKVGYFTSWFSSNESKD